MRHPLMRPNRRFNLTDAIGFFGRSVATTGKCFYGANRLGARVIGAETQDYAGSTVKWSAIYSLRGVVCNIMT